MKKSVIKILLALTFIFAGCNQNFADSTTHINGTNGNPTEIKPTDIFEGNEDFFNLISKQIAVVNKNEPHTGEIDVDTDWLEERLGESQLCETPSDILALSFRMVITYEDGTTAALRLLNDYEGACVLYYNGDSYCFKNDEIARWFLDESSQEDSISPENKSHMDGFTVLTNKQISKVRIDLPTGRIETGIDIEWLENELKVCHECELPSNSDKKDLPVDIYYEDNTISELLIYNMEDAYFILRDDRNSYCFKSESIARWLMEIKDNKEDEDLPQIDFAVYNDVNDYTKGMTFPIVRCIQRENDEEIIDMYISIVFKHPSEYNKIENNGTTAYVSVEDDGRLVEVVPGSYIKTKLSYFEDNRDINSYFGEPAEYVNNMISSLRYVGMVSLFLIDGTIINRERSAEPIYEVEYIYSPQLNGLYFSCMPGGNNISVTCNNECVFEVNDAMAENFENISEAAINYGYDEAINIIEDYGYNEDDIQYCVFVYSNAFSNEREVYIPVWEFGLQNTTIQIDADGGKLYDYCPSR